MSDKKDALYAALSVAVKSDDADLQALGLLAALTVLSDGNNNPEAVAKVETVLKSVIDFSLDELEELRKSI